MLMLSSLVTQLAHWPLPWVGLVVALVGYVVGSIPTAYVVAKVVKGIDIRQHGSGNVGGTNVWRTCGKYWGWLTYAIDGAKGYVPVALVLMWVPPHHDWLAAVMACSLLFGHSKSLFLGFSGGKASITGLGTIIAFAPLAGLISGVLAFTIIGITRLVSVASLVSACVAWLIVAWLGGSSLAIGYTAAAGAYVIVRHVGNIKRLLQGSENRV
jgi:acyl phosphate:glycerol-3-phosphate acyltransferase